MPRSCRPGISSFICSKLVSSTAGAGGRPWPDQWVGGRPFKSRAVFGVVAVAGGAAGSVAGPKERGGEPGVGSEDDAVVEAAGDAAMRASNTVVRRCKRKLTTCAE